MILIIQNGYSVAFSTSSVTHDVSYPILDKIRRLNTVDYILCEI